MTAGEADHTACLSESLPCSNTTMGNLFLLAVYGAIISFGAKCIADGSDHLLKVLPAGIIGGVLLPVLGALPDCAIIAASVFSAWTAGRLPARQVTVREG